MYTNGPLVVDAGAPDDGAATDVSVADAVANDAPSVEGSVDSGIRPSDAGSLLDASLDARVDSSTEGDAGAPDAGPSPPNGLSTPCENGPGWTLLRFHYQGSTTASVDVWDASCNYSLSSSSQCLVEDVGSLVVVGGGTAVSVNGSDVIRIRYSVAGINFSRATVWVQARSFSTSATTNIELWSPIHGSRITGPVSQEFTYFWYSTDWTGFVSPSDLPGLTAIEISPSGGSNDLAVHAVEICLE